MYRYTFPKSIIKYVNEKNKHGYWAGGYDFFINYFKIKNSPMFWAVLGSFYKNINFTYYSKTKLNFVPISGYLLNVSLFEETKL